ncbi:MAG TPA: sigma-70 family RNA polymerase sigma factor [Gammaproteobacteria bacterium]|nr:sigma-70 family RNA polymerase sigma factor [Gammaproteobacteria bacterium]
MANAPEQDPEWLGALRRQDKAAFTRLVRTYQTSMMALARSLVGRDAAGDVVQDSWISAYRALPAFEGRSSIRTWLLRITGNRAISHLRTRGRLINETDLLEPDVTARFGDNGRWREPPVPWSEDTPEGLLASEQLRQALDAGLETMPPLQRTVLQLRETENLSSDQICKILDISASNLYVLLHRARTRLWSIVDAHQRS